MDRVETVRWMVEAKRREVWEARRKGATALVRAREDELRTLEGELKEMVDGETFHVKQP